jgi:hypothetical protein
MTAPALVPDEVRRRLADEYDAAQARGEVVKDGRSKTVPEQNGFGPANAANLGLTGKAYASGDSDSIELKEGMS